MLVLLNKSKVLSGGCTLSWWVIHSSKYVTSSLSYLIEKQRKSMQLTFFLIIGSRDLGTSRIMVKPRFSG